MTREQVMNLARKLASLQEEVRYNDMMNMSAITEERVEQIARASLLRKQINSTQKAYDKAFEEWESIFFPE